MIHIRRTRRVIRGQGEHQRIESLMNYERNSSHTLDQHVDHVLQIIRRLEEDYVFSSSQKTLLLQKTLNGPENKSIKHIWERIEEQYNHWHDRWFGTLVEVFMKHWQIEFVKSAVKRTTILSISPSLRRQRLGREHWLLRTTSRIINDVLSSKDG